ncbi:hypothetical protein HQQ80_17060 [Microbacteriaceae bacterium VKM Ac-2855]|nr:hypothetical protein [Microbacteriaceae bacterium VKM Ac-2855]
MRTSQPDPSNPWPHDMLLSIDTPNSLLKLLFIRHAWRLDIGEVPELDEAPPIGDSALPAGVDATEAAERWRAEWRRAWSAFDPRDRVVREPDEDTARLLRELSDDELVDAYSTQPSAFWDGGMDADAYGAWVMRPDELHAMPLEQQPERRNLAALIPAWRSGLRTIIELPYAGPFADRLHPETLVVSRRTRRDPELYTAALSPRGS